MKNFQAFLIRDSDGHLIIVAEHVEAPLLVKILIEKASKEHPEVTELFHEPGIEEADILSQVTYRTYDDETLIEEIK